MPVLVIDDEEQFLYFIMLSLRSNGITNVITCIPGVKAKEYFITMDFSAVVLDINIPDIRGTELLEDVIEMHPETPVIMVTAIDKAEIAVECMKRGAMDYFVKPFDYDKMLTALRNAISQRELRVENEALKGYLLGADLKNRVNASNINSYKWPLMARVGAHRCA